MLALRAFVFVGVGKVRAPVDDIEVVEEVELGLLHSQM